MASVAVIITDPKQSEARVKHESVALPEEIDKGSMCDEIVGSSGALQKVLSLVSKVAPTGATVLITGETGTPNPYCSGTRQLSKFRHRLDDAQLVFSTTYKWSANCHLGARLRRGSRCSGSRERQTEKWSLRLAAN